MVDIPQDADLASAIRAVAAARGLDPLDLGTTISYETGGTFDPWKKGPVTKWGEHRGLIQWGEPQRQKYGVTQDMPVSAQVEAIGRYLDDAGVKKGHGLLDIYSAVNAGRVGKYNASDAAAGGAPGSVADKVAGMAPHRIRASLLLNGKLPEGIARSAGPARVAAAPAVAGGAPMSLAPAGEVGPAGGDAGLAALIQMAQRIAADAQERDMVEAPAVLPPLQVGPLNLNMGRRRA